MLYINICLIKTKSILDLILELCPWKAQCNPMWLNSMCTVRRRWTVGPPQNSRLDPPLPEMVWTQHKNGRGWLCWEKVGGLDWGRGYLGETTGEMDQWSEQVVERVGRCGAECGEGRLMKLLPGGPRCWKYRWVEVIIILVQVLNGVSQTYW